MPEMRKWGEEERRDQGGGSGQWAVERSDQKKKKTFGLAAYSFVENRGHLQLEPEVEWR